jgi:hypothetical protein
VAAGLGPPPRGRFEQAGLVCKTCKILDGLDGTQIPVATLKVEAVTNYVNIGYLKAAILNWDWNYAASGLVEQGNGRERARLSFEKSSPQIVER